MLRRLHSLIKGSRDVSQAVDSSAAHHHHHAPGDHPLQLVAQPREGPVPRGLLQSGVGDHNEFRTAFPRELSRSGEEQEQHRASSSIDNNININMPEAEESSCEGYSDTSCREKYEDAFETIDLQESSSNSAVKNGKEFSRGEVSGSANESNPVMAKGVQLDEGFTAIDISKEEEEKNLGKGGGGGAGPERSISMLSLDNLECCRICQQQHTEEPLIDLGCSCRGELAKAHRSCIDMWFKNKGSNKCEVCQHVAVNIPAPASQPIPHFWVWRVGGPYTIGQASSTYSTRVGLYNGLILVRPVLLEVIQRHPFLPVLWLLLLAFMTYLFVDAINTSTIGYAAMPIGFLFGVLVVLGMGTAVRLVLECCHERIMQRNLRRLELQPMSSGYEAPLQVVTQSSDVQTQPPAQPPAQPLTQSTELGA